MHQSAYLKRVINLNKEMRVGRLGMMDFVDIKINDSLNHVRSRMLDAVYRSDLKELLSLISEDVVDINFRLRMEGLRKMDMLIEPEEDELCALSVIDMPLIAVAVKCNRLEMIKALIAGGADAQVTWVERAPESFIEVGASDKEGISEVAVLTTLEGKPMVKGLLDLYFTDAKIEFIPEVLYELVESKAVLVNPDTLDFLISLPISDVRVGCFLELYGVLPIEYQELLAEDARVVPMHPLSREDVEFRKSRLALDMQRVTIAARSGVVRKEGYPTCSGLEVDDSRDYCRVKLIEAIKDGDLIELRKMLDDYRLDPNFRFDSLTPGRYVYNQWDKTPLMLALETGSYEMVHLLINYGANPLQQTFRRMEGDDTVAAHSRFVAESPLDYAISLQLKDMRIYYLLMDQGAKMLNPQSLDVISKLTPDLIGFEEVESYFEHKPQELAEMLKAFRLSTLPGVSVGLLRHLHSDSALASPSTAETIISAEEGGVLAAAHSQGLSAAVSVRSESPLSVMDGARDTDEEGYDSDDDKRPARRRPQTIIGR